MTPERHEQLFVDLTRADVEAVKRGGVPPGLDSNEWDLYKIATANAWALVVALGPRAFSPRQKVDDGSEFSECELVAMSNGTTCAVVYRGFRGVAMVAVATDGVGFMSAALPSAGTDAGAVDSGDWEAAKACVRVEISLKLGAVDKGGPLKPPREKRFSPDPRRPGVRM